MARVRKQAGTDEALREFEGFVVRDPMEYKGKWNSVFGNENPIRAEIGMGKGQFIRTMAAQNPDINYIGVEVVPEVVLTAIKRMERMEGRPENLRIILYNAAQLQDMFADGELDRIYLNFSDPWPKFRHAKRRLTYHSFLNQYADVMKPDGEVHFKTDNQGLFEFSLNEFAAYDWKLKNIQLDLYRKLPEDNIATEYETKFHKNGQPIYRLEAIKPSSKCLL